MRKEKRKEERKNQIFPVNNNHNLKILNIQNLFLGKTIRRNAPTVCTVSEKFA